MKADYKEQPEEKSFKVLSESEQRTLENAYNCYWALLYKHARKVLKNDFYAEDIVQNVFLKLSNNIGNLNSEQILSYLHTSVRNGVIDVIRKDGNKNRYVLYVERYNQEGYCTTDYHLRENQLKELIEREVSMLPPKMRDIFELSRKKFLSHKEIAETTGASEGTVKKQLYYAIKILRSKLSCMFFLSVMHAILALHKFIRLF